MALEFNGTSHYLEATSGVSSVVSDFPVTFLAWVRPNNTGGGGPGVETAIALSDRSTSGSNGVRVRANLDTDADERAGANANPGGDNHAAWTPTLSIAGTWEPLVITDDGTDRSVYFAGQTGSESAAVASLTGIDTLTIGAWNGGGRVNYFNGGIAECAIWNRVFDAGEIGTLQARFSPLCIPNGLVFYAPLWRETYDLVGGLALSGGSTGGQTDHPPIIYPTGPAIGHKAAASGPWTDPVGLRRVRIYTGYDASQRSSIRAEMES